jgi:toxin CcdB
MAQFDVYARVGRTKSYVVDLQADLLEQMALRVVAPMVMSSTAAVISGLTPLVQFQDNEYIVLMYQLAAIPARELQDPVGSLSADQDAIKRALDILFLDF